MNLKPIATGTAAGLCLIPSLVSAQLLYHEPFDYPAPDTLLGQNGGVGFSDAWLAGGTNPSAEVEEASLGYTDAGGATLMTAGNKARVLGPATNFRILGAPMAGINAGVTTLYASVLVDQTGGNQTRYTNLSFFQGGTERISIGHASSQSNWGVNFNGNGALGVFPAGAPAVPALDHPAAFLVLKVELNVNAAGEDRISVFSNPVLGFEPSPTGTYLSTGNILTTLNSLTQIRMSSGGVSGANPATDAQYDELRIGLTWDDVTPSTGGDPAVVLESAALTRTSGTIKVRELNGADVDEDGDFSLIVSDQATGTELVLSNVVVTKNESSEQTTITFDAPFAPSTTYDYYVEVPRVDSTIDFIAGTLNSHLFPDSLPGPAGTDGSWGIREYTITANPNNIAGALAVLDAGTAPITDGSAPVFNHSDPDTNTPATTGNFNNDFPILSNAAGGQDWVVIGKTQLTIPAAGAYTFGVHSDDGFAMRITGAGGGSFISKNGAGFIDPADPQTLAFNGPTGDSNTRGVYQFDAAGTYELQYLGWDGSGGGYYEVAWAPGAFTEDKDTNTWNLVGDSTDPSIPDYRARFLSEYAGPAASGNTFGIRTYLMATGVTNIAQALTFLASTTRQPDDADGLTVDAQRNYLNAVDPEAVGAGGVITPNEPFPGNTPADDNNVVTSAKGRISVEDAGFYTFWVHSDDGSLFRIKGVNGTFNPSIKRAVGAGSFQMSNQNELLAGGNGNTRVIVFLEEGSYDIDFISAENAGGFGYELVSAKGEWPTGTPPTGWQLVGFYPLVTSLVLPQIVSADGWTLESSQPNLSTTNPELGLPQITNIATAEQSIDATLALDPRPAAAVTTWDRLDFRDLPGGSQGSFTATSTAFPFDTTAADTYYANRATATLEITEAGDYHLGFQGDDGGYLQIDAITGPPAQWTDIYESLLPAVAAIVDAEGGTRNRLQVDTGTGNSRTLGRITLGVGTYALKTLVFQGTGGSWWEVIGAKATDISNFSYPLLARNGPATTEITPGLQLLAQVEVVGDGGFIVTDFTTSGTPINSAGFNFGTEAGADYSIEVSTDLANWTPVTATITDNGNGTSSAVIDFTGQTVNGSEPLIGQAKLFIRVVEAP